MNKIFWTHAFTGRLTDVVIRRAAPEMVSNRLKCELEEGKLPFINYPYMQKLEQELPQVLNSLPKARHLILLGIGGSALGAKALQKAFFPQQDRPGHDGPWLWIADNIDVSSLEAWLSSLNPAETVVAVVSKSGGTLETVAQYFIIKPWLQKALGDAWHKHLIFITDTNEGFLRQEATNLGAASLAVPDNLGGRYSIFSAVGLFPAAFLGIDWKALVKGAMEITMPLADDPDIVPKHPAFRLALWAYALTKQQYSELIFFNYIPQWNALGQWFTQLWAESLGKEGKGSMPIPAVGVTDQHSLQQMFLDGPENKGCMFLSCDGLPKGPEFSSAMPERWAALQGKRFGDILSAEALATRMAMIQCDIPLVHLNTESADEASCGRVMGLCMAATLFTGWLSRINPLDQPAVELGKRLANAYLGLPGFEHEKADLAVFMECEKKSQDVQDF